MALITDVGNAVQYNRQVGAVAYAHRLAEFKAALLSPVLRVDNPRGVLRTFGFETFMGTSESTGSTVSGDSYVDGAKPPGVESSESTVAYVILPKQTPRKLTIMGRKVHEALGGDYQQHQSNAAMYTELIAIERQLSTKAAALASYNSANRVTLSGTDQWTDKSASDPFGDIDTRVAALRGFGQLPMDTTVTFNQDGWDALKRHPAPQARINYVQTGFLTAANLIEFYKFRDVVFLYVTYNAAKNGVLTPNAQPIWGDDMMFLNIDSAQGEDSQGFFRLVAMDDDINADGSPIIQMGSLDPSKPEVTEWWVIAKAWRDMIVHAELRGGLIKDIV